MATPSPSGYSLGNILKKEPAVVTAAVVALLPVLVLAGLVDWSAEAVAGVELALTGLLGLFYVRPNVNTDATVARAEQAAFDRGVATARRSQ